MGEKRKLRKNEITSKSPTSGYIPPRGVKKKSIQGGGRVKKEDEGERDKVREGEKDQKRQMKEG